MAQQRHTQANNNKRKDKIMKRENIIRAWKDEAYRLSLSEAERAHLPENPAGSIELDDAALGGAAGGMKGCSLGAGSICWCSAHVCCSFHCF
jgi:mersacidin/lichenicidin family type 2 lantibiotic